MAAPDPTSRYSGLAEIRIVAPDGTTRVFIAPRVVPTPPVRGSYTIRAGGSSKLTVKAIDRTLELDLEEKVVAWPGTSESGIAEAIFGSYGLSTKVEDTSAGPDPDVHVLIQRATDLAFLRALATKWGYAV